MRVFTCMFVSLQMYSLWCRCLIEIYGITVCQPSPAQAMKIIAQQISDRDNPVRSAALNTVVIGHSILGETIYKYIGNVSTALADSVIAMYIIVMQCVFFIAVGQGKRHAGGENQACIEVPTSFSSGGKGPVP